MSRYDLLRLWHCTELHGPVSPGVELLNCKSLQANVHPMWAPQDFVKGRDNAIGK